MENLFQDKVLLLMQISGKLSINLLIINNYRTRLHYDVEAETVLERGIVMLVMASLKCSDDERNRQRHPMP